MKKSIRVKTFLLGLISPLFFLLVSAQQKQEMDVPQKEMTVPRISLITSVYKADEFLDGFLEDITHIKNFSECELILINPNSPGREEPRILEYVKKYPNIIYEKLDHDPGIYGTWNYAIQKARGRYIANANVDDRRNPDFIEKQARYLDEHPDVDLVYSDYYITEKPNETWENNHYRWIVTPEQKTFNPWNMYLCLPGPQPLWRASMHTRYGLFREDFYAIGDLEFWNRAVTKGSKFAYLEGLSGLFYQNPHGLSNNKDPQKIFQRETEHVFVRAAYGYLWHNPSLAGPRLLIKIPTRSRPKQFFTQLEKYYRLLSGNIQYHFLITCGSDDLSMNNPDVKRRLASYPNLTVSFDTIASKVEAYNKGLDQIDFDIVLATADDMEPVTWGYDKVIADTMALQFPDFDGVLNFNDGHVGAACNTLPVVGKKFYERFHYLFHPDYQSLFANEELTLVSRMLGKEHVCDKVIIKHNHPVWGLAEWDNLYLKNEGFKERDRTVFAERRAHDFYAPVTHDKDWSILICTLEERAEKFKKLYHTLTDQISALGLQDNVEILFFKDNRGEHTVGYKRNDLLRRSRGKYTNFVDDDDTVHPQYVKMVHNALQSDPDTVRLTGIMTTNGKNPELFEHSIQYNNKYTYEYGKYVRPPNHLTPMRRSVASQFLFPETNFGEDKEWTLAIARSGLLKKEVPLEEPYYFYNYDNKYSQEAISESQEEQNKDRVLHYFVTAVDYKYFDNLLTFIGNVHQMSAGRLGGIAVANLGMTPEQLAQLRTIDKVTVIELERTNPDIIKPFKTTSWGKEVPGWYAWKPVAVKQALGLFPYVLWTDSTTVILKPLDNLFKHIKQNGYFLATIGNEVIQGAFRHPLSWCTTAFVVDAFKLKAPDKEWVLSQEQVMATTFGVSREGADAFLLPLYELSKDMRYFADDGSTPDGFGTGRHDQALLGVYAYTNGLRVLRQDYTEQQPMMLRVDKKPVAFFMTWHGGYVNEKTCIFNARAAIQDYRDYQKAIVYKK